MKQLSLNNSHTFYDTLWYYMRINCVESFIKLCCYDIEKYYRYRTLNKMYNDYS